MTFAIAVNAMDRQKKAENSDNGHIAVNLPNAQHDAQRK